MNYLMRRWWIALMLNFQENSIHAKLVQKLMSSLILCWTKRLSSARNKAIKARCGTINRRKEGYKQKTPQHGLHELANQLLFYETLHHFYKKGPFEKMSFKRLFVHNKTLLTKFSKLLRIATFSFSKNPWCIAKSLVAISQNSTSWWRISRQRIFWNRSLFSKHKPSSFPSNSNEQRC